MAKEISKNDLTEETVVTRRAAIQILATAGAIGGGMFATWATGAATAADPRAAQPALGRPPHPMSLPLQKEISYWQSLGGDFYLGSDSKPAVLLVHGMGEPECWTKPSTVGF